MESNFVPKINLPDRISTSKLDNNAFIQPMRLDSIEGLDGANSVDFKGVLGGMVNELNQSITAADEITKDAMLGKADVHDVMAAISKSEINVTIATTAVGKIVQTYEKIMQISI